ncbi:hypothetical protein CYG48_17985 (plasmid) [Neorhizobium sp. SOG26]|nr:hypothetical protein CYG48_17985 [Neorhizobium sp. SOG26]
MQLGTPKTLPKLLLPLWPLVHLKGASAETAKPICAMVLRREAKIKDACASLQRWTRRLFSLNILPAERT